MADCDNNGRVWGVVWTEVFPWLIIFRTFRIAISFRLLLFGAAGMIAMFAGAYMIGWGFSGNEGNGDGRSASTGARLIQETDWFSHLFGYDANVGWTLQEGEDGVRTVKPRVYKFCKTAPQIMGIWDHFVMPFDLARLSRHETKNLGYCISIGVWTVFVWGFLGIAIARSAAVGLVSGGRLSIREMLFFGLSKWRAGLAAPLLPFVVMAFLAIPILLLSVLLRFGFLAWIGAVAWPISLLAGLLIVILMLGLIFGWPLMISAISVEGSDCFDALSRTYAYIYQRPLQYLFYVALALLFGAFGWFFVILFAHLVIETTQWIGSWAVLGGSYDSDGPFHVIRAWTVIFKLFVLSFSATYFWTASVAVYLLLRRDTDAVEMDEIYSENKGMPRELPKIVTDEQGAPVVQG